MFRLFSVCQHKALLTCVSEEEASDCDGEKVAQHIIQVVNIGTLEMCDSDFRVTIHPPARMEIFF